MTASVRIGIVAGEASGDIIGADLIKVLRTLSPDISFEGIGGPLMEAQGFNSFFPMERLSVMGLLEPLKRLPELLRIRRFLKQHFINIPPDIFIGIDSPDFNLNLELALRQQSILTVHYVSPSVWAWRQGRIKKIAKSVDRMLTLLPFEAAFYREHNVPVTFVGHPLADQLPIEVDKAAARIALGYSMTEQLIALMPGSRGGEVRMMAQAFIETARWCLHQRSDLKFIIPAANSARFQQIKQAVAEYGAGLPITVVEGRSQEVMAAADVVLMASGTAALEALLLKKPMVVAYRMAPFSFAIISRLFKADFFSLPNLLASEALVPEVVQDDVRPEMLGPLILERLENNPDQALLKQRFIAIHKELRRSASTRAAEVLLQMIKNKQLAQSE